MLKALPRESWPKLMESLSPELETRNAEYWRSRAKETGAIAEQMVDLLSRAAMENIATSYEKLADWAARQRG